LARRVAERDNEEDPPMTDKSLTLIDGGREVEQYNPGEG